jgi:hypothetical protein
MRRNFSLHFCIRLSFFLYVSVFLCPTFLPASFLFSLSLSLTSMCDSLT